MDIVERQQRALAENDERASSTGVSTVLRTSRGLIGASAVVERDRQSLIVIRFST